VHYHLKKLKEMDFLGQNNKGEYHLLASYNSHAIQKEGIINCRYHAKNLNVDWCTFCGNPICEKCFTTMQNGLISCPECKERRNNSSLKLSFLFIVLLTIVITVVLSLGIVDFSTTIIVIGLYFLSIVIYSFQMNSFYKERKEYGSWKRTLEDQPVTVINIQSLIVDKKMYPCKYHDDILGTNRCERCKNFICSSCSKIYRTFTSTEILCKECFFRAQNHKIKQIFLILLLPLSLFLIIFFYVIVTFIGEIPLSLYFAGLLFFSVYIMFFLLMTINFFVNKKKCSKFVSSYS